MLNPDSDSRRIIFLYPHQETVEEIITKVFSNEFEIYVIDDHLSARKLISAINKSFLFINIDKTLKNLGWIDYINEIKQLSEIKDVMTGVITGNNSLIDSYRSMSNIALSLERGPDACTRIIIEILENINARGRRKYIRAKCNNSYRSSFSIKLGKTIYSGTINDISSFAMACTCLEEVNLEPETFIDDLQLRLDTRIIKTSGEVIAMRKEDNIYIIKFDPLKTQPVKGHIRTFIFNTLQKALHDKIKEFDKEMPVSK